MAAFTESTPTRSMHMFVALLSEMIIISTAASRTVISTPNESFESTPEPSVLDVHGADALRWYLYTASPPGNSRRFSTELVGEVSRRFISTLWNTYSFFVTYASIANFDPSSKVEAASRTELDAALARTSSC